MPRANVILAAMAARATGRPGKCAVTRAQMFAVTGDRAPAIQRVRLRGGPPGVRREGRWLTGTGVAASTYPARAMPSQARVTVSQSGRYQVLIAAADIGTGARTALLAVAAEALGVPAAAIDLRIGDSTLPPAMIAGGSMGTASWTWAVIKACRALREAVRARDGAVPPGGLSALADTTADIGALESQLASRARYAFGAQFAEIRVDKIGRAHV